MTVPQSSAAQNVNGKTIPHDPAVPEPEHPAGLERPVCAHLGLYDDEKTWLAFPSPGNHCHRVRPAGSIDLVHQQTHCLNANHVSCPVWQLQKQPRRLPRPLQYAPPGRSGQGTRLALLVLLVIFLAIVDGLLLWTQLRATASQASPPSAGTDTLPDVAAAMPSAAPSVAAALITKRDMPTPTAGATTTLPPPRAVVTEALLKLHSGPGSDYPVLLTAEQGAQYEITGRHPTSDWWRVCCILAGTAGWVPAEAIAINGNTSQTPAIDDIPPPDAP